MALFPRRLSRPPHTTGLLEEWTTPSARRGAFLNRSRSVPFHNPDPPAAESCRPGDRPPSLRLRFSLSRSAHSATSLPADRRYKREAVHATPLAASRAERTRPRQRRTPVTQASSQEIYCGLLPFGASEFSKTIWLSSPCRTTFM